MKVIRGLSLLRWAKLEDFREDVYGSLVLNMDEKDLEKACAFLDSKDVTWEVIK